MGTVNIENRDGVTVVTLNDGKANTLGTATVQALAETAESLGRERGGVVITGVGRSFCAGLDLGEVIAMDRDHLGAFLDRFERMAVAWFGLTRPVVAALNGHALAGGAIMAMAADFRLSAQGESKFGLTETALGIPFPASALELVRYHLDPSRAARVLLAGELYTPADAVAAGLVDRVVAPEALVGEAVALAAKLGKTPGTAYAQTKSTMRADALQRIEAWRSKQRNAFVEALTTPPVSDHLRETVKAMKKK